MNEIEIHFVERETETIDFSETDSKYITDCDTFEIADNLLHAAGIEFDDYTNRDLVINVEYALFQLKAIAQNEYNNNYYRMLLYVLNKVSENVNNYFVS